MNSRQAVRAAIDHQPAERIPYCVQITADAWEQLAPHVEAEGAAGFLDNDVATFAPPWWRWHELGPQWRALDAPAEPPRVVGTGGYEDFFRAVTECRENTDKYVLVTIYGSHFEKAYFSRGIENFLADMAGAPEFAAGLLRKIIEKNLVMLENVLSIPAIDGVLLGSDWGSQQDLLMSPACWEEMIRPGEQAEYDLVHSYGKDVWVHSCGNVEKILPSLVEMGLDVLNPIQPEAMDLAWLKDRFGADLAFWGGVSTQQTLPYGTPDDVRREARQVRDRMSAGGGYIFSPAQAIQADVPAENLLALLEVAREKR